MKKTRRCHTRLLIKRRKCLSRLLSLSLLLQLHGGQARRSESQSHPTVSVPAARWPPACTGQPQSGGSCLDGMKSVTDAGTRQPVWWGQDLLETVRL